MFEICQGYKFAKIQKVSPHSGDAFSFAIIYKFFTNPSVREQILKYLIRAEYFDDISTFALKFYADGTKN